MTVVAFRAPAQALQQGLGEQVQGGGRSLRYVQVGAHVVPLVEQWGDPGPVRWERFAQMREHIERDEARWSRVVDIKGIEKY